MDNLTKEQRRKNMQNIKSKGSDPERIIMRELRKQNIYFAKHVETLPGKPDIVFRKRKIVVFVDSDFWHGHPKRCIMPKSNVRYWKNKIKMNIQRDRNVNKQLKKLGWKVVRIWEYDVKHNLDKCINRILRAIKKD